MRARLTRRSIRSKFSQAHPYDADSLAAMVTFLEQSGDAARALTYANRLEELEPGNPQVQQMLKDLHDHLQDSKTKS